MTLLPLRSMSIGLLVRGQLNDEHTGLSMFKPLLVIRGLGGALGIQHEYLKGGTKVYVAQTHRAVTHTYSVAFYPQCFVLTIFFMQH